MKLLFKKLVFLLLPIQLIVIITNCIVDPANLVSEKKTINEIVSIMLKGHNVDNISNYNERLLQKEFLSKQTVQPDIIIIGSSRIMQISSNLFPNKKVLNCGVSHANINDLVALTGLLDSTKLLPKKIFINVDPVVIADGNEGTIEWTNLIEYHRLFIAKHSKQHFVYNVSDDNFKKLYTLMSFEYFKKSIPFIFSRQNQQKIKDVGTNIPQMYGRLSDCSISYPYQHMHPNVNMVIKNNTSNLYPMPQYNIQSQSLLTDIINYYKSKNCQVVLIMMPFFNTLYDDINNKQNNYLYQQEIFFNEFAQQNKIEIMGSFSPYKSNIKMSEFYDGIHCSKSAINKIFNIKQ